MLVKENNRGEGEFDNGKLKPLQKEDAAHLESLGIRTMGSHAAVQTSTTRKEAIGFCLKSKNYYRRICPGRYQDKHGAES